MKRFVAATGLALCASQANAVVLDWSSSLDTAQAVATNGGSPIASGSGTAHGSFDTDTNVLTWVIDFSGLSAGVTVAHFHGPSAGPGTNAAVTVEVPTLPGTVPGVTAGSIIGSEDLDNLAGAATVAAWKEHFKAGLLYINVHTTNFRGGEIRGQVSLPAPASAALLGLGVAGLAVSRRTRNNPTA